MSSLGKALLSGLGLLAASAFLACVATVVVVFTAGKTVAGGERAVLVAGGFDLLLACLTIALFWFWNRGSTLPGRLAGTALFAISEVGALALLFIITVVLLNR